MGGSVEKRPPELEVARADLHMHSNHSDGLLRPARLVELAVEAGLRAVALTDHDTITGLGEFMPAALEAGLEAVPGVELSTNYKGCDLHVLGYFFDHEDPRFLEALEEFRQAREGRAERIVNRLRELGLGLDWEEVQRSGGGGTLGRPHIARCLAARGFVPGVEEAFQQYLGVGKPGYVERYKFDTLKAIELIREAGGAVVLAHPGTATDPEVVPELAASGRLDGMEITHPRNESGDLEGFIRLAEANDLLQTGGSDFHGDPTRPGEAAMGEFWIPLDSVEALRCRAGSRVQ